MRGFSVFAAAVVLACAAASPGRADGPPAGPAPQAAASCDEPGPGYRPHRRPIRHPVRYHVRRHRYWRPPVMAFVPPPILVPAPIYYNALLPAPYNTDYDRGMVLHYRSAHVSGVYYEDPGFPPTPPIKGVQWYRIAGPDGATLQYDGLTGQYIRLAQNDPALVPAPPPGYR